MSFFMHVSRFHSYVKANDKFFIFRICTSVFSPDPMALFYLIFWSSQQESYKTNIVEPSFIAFIFS